ncbi:unnamed protein product [Phyllotreta striolata]|uniref:Uncharacterized protein n=1 Tax=Phyllotreta striolata TaxID=444603 RepID=A0A9N9TWY5_PHYSR|nr:unnamed protein product [Phyllotreta striolata]
MRKLIPKSFINSLFSNLSRIRRFSNGELAIYRPTQKRTIFHLLLDPRESFA